MFEGGPDFFKMIKGVPQKHECYQVGVWIFFASKTGSIISSTLLGRTDLFHLWVDRLTSQFQQVESTLNVYFATVTKFDSYLLSCMWLLAIIIIIIMMMTIIIITHAHALLTLLL